MIYFHPEVHCAESKAKKESLKTKAINGEIVLLLECKQYNEQSNEHILGFEDMNNYPISILCSAYQMSDVPYYTLQEGGTHSIAVLMFFLLSVLWHPKMKQYAEKWQNETWFCDYSHFLEDIEFDLNDYENSSQNMKTHIRKRAALRGGLPAQVSYRFIHDCCKYMVLLLHPESDLNDTIINYTLIQREKYMAKNILHVAARFTKDIHVCIGAGHLMPFLDFIEIQNLKLNPFFETYHQAIKEKRLLHHISDSNSDFKIQLL
jgi:hypothetical protein